MSVNYLFHFKSLVLLILLFIAYKPFFPINAAYTFFVQCKTEYDEVLFSLLC